MIALAWRRIGTYATQLGYALPETVVVRIPCNVTFRGARVCLSRCLRGVRRRSLEFGKYIVRVCRLVLNKSPNFCLVVRNVVGISNGVLMGLT